MLIFYFFVPRHGGERGGGWVSYLCSRNQIKTGSRFNGLRPVQSSRFKVQSQSDPRVDDKAAKPRFNGPKAQFKV